MKVLSRHSARGDAQGDTRAVAHSRLYAQKSSYHFSASRDKSLRFYANLCRREAAEWMIYMMDLFMAAILLASFLSVKLLADWCDRQLKK